MKYKETRGRPRKYDFSLSPKEPDNYMALPYSISARASLSRYAKENRQKFKTWVENGVLHIIRIK